MADAKISQILATLAQQGVRPNSATPQMPPNMNMPYPNQQGQMPMIPPSMPQQPVPNTYSPYPTMGGYGAPSMPQPGYGLPQPMSSGSLDLSSIRPMKSGTMDFGGSSRGYKRSRSRSPDRHHRDSYRDDRRRDRSRSPDRGHHRGGDPDEQGSDTLDIPSGLVGLIIGRAGDNLRRVENDTNTRVQFTPVAESRGPNRECKIRGTRVARDRARREIQRIIEDGGKGSELPPYGLIPKEQMSGNMPLAPQPAQRRVIPGEGGSEENALQIMVPNKTVGLIIGRGGETIRDLQEKSGCHVNITSEDQSRNGLRPVNLIGTPSAQAVARDLILQVVDSDNKGTGASGANAIIAGAVPLQSQNQNQSAGGSINETIMVPSEAVGMIIGKGGETIKEMQNTTGCKINVSQPTGVDLKRSIALIGSSAAIERAKTAINEKVHAMEEKRGVRRQDNPNYAAPLATATQSAASNVQPGSYGGYQSSGYAQQASATPASAPAAGGAAAPAGGQDPYAAWGGYQNYVAAYYAMTQQQGQGQGQPGQK